MAGKKFDGNGCTIKGAAEISAGVNSITAPGWVKQEIDDSDLSNSEVQTAIASALKKYNACTVNVDFSILSALTANEENQLWTITFPKGKGSMTFWGEILSIADSQFMNGQSPTCDVQILVTNRNASGVETKPVLTISEGGK